MLQLSSEILNYCIDHSTQPSDIAKELQLKTIQSFRGHHMLIGELEGSILQFLIKLGKVKKVLEFGTFTGYSSLVMAEALPDDGNLVTVDINPHTTELAKDFWEKSPHGKKIQLILRPGKESLPDLEKLGPYDLIFIDADKNGYPDYLQWSLKNLSNNGLIITDNTLWSGKVLNTELDSQTESIKRHNEMARSLIGFTKTLLPIRDGMYLLMKTPV